MESVFWVMVAVAFIAGCVGFLVWVGNRFETDPASWYPAVPMRVATRALSVAALAAAVAFVIRVFSGVT